jgi:DNA (cytosine-5)-methyltransferase 1
MRLIEICAGAGGQALGLEQAGFSHVALVEIDKMACETLRKNRPKWNIIEGDVKTFSAKEYIDIDLFAGGVPCPPFSIAGKQLGSMDDRDLFPEALRLIKECMPKAVMLENVRGLLSPKFDDYRNQITNELKRIGYHCRWKLLQASDFGIPQLRPRTVMVALRGGCAPYFKWPQANESSAPTVGQVLLDEMSKNGWVGAANWAAKADDIAPTLVGGSKKHGGPDLGPTRARNAWKNLGVDGLGIADGPPARDFVGNPKLTVKMASLIQGFPDDWVFFGSKTPAYKQVGNAFPPAVAKAVGEAIMEALVRGEQALLEEEDVLYGEAFGGA